MSSDAFYNKMAATMLKLLTKLGTTVTFSRTTGQTLDPRAGASGGSTTTPTSKGVLTDYEDRMIDGTLIQQGDRLLVLDNTNVPVMDDLITISSENWVIKSVKTIKPADVVVGYFAQVRG